jgi:phage I-like protein
MPEMSAEELAEMIARVGVEYPFAARALEAHIAALEANLATSEAARENIQGMSDLAHEEVRCLQAQNEWLREALKQLEVHALSHGTHPIDSAVVVSVARQALTQESKP